MQITTYKGFKQDLTCRGFQFELGKTFEHKAKLRPALRASIPANTRWIASATTRQRKAVTPKPWRTARSAKKTMATAKSPAPLLPSKPKYPCINWSPARLNGFGALINL
jgi:hypothetical protein